MPSIKIRVIWTGIAILLTLRCLGQISIMIVKPQKFQVKVSDIFNAEIINNGNQAINLYLVGYVLNLKTGLKIAEGKTGVREFKTGLNHVNEALLEPVYSYHSDIVGQTGFLPFGNYELCIKAYTYQSNEEIGIDCIDEEVTPLSPPLLLSPENGSVISTPDPLLVWIPPAPVNITVKILYELRLSELQDNQTPYDAISRNYSVFEQNDIKNTFQQYPSNALPIEVGKTYAWKIIAKTSSGIFIGETEIWTFKYEQQTSNKNNNFLNPIGVASKNPNTGYLLVTNDTLNFTFEDRNVDFNVGVSFKLFDMNNKEVEKTCKIKLNNKGNSNVYSLFLNQCEDINDGFYQLNAFNNKNEVFIIRFKIESKQ